MKSYLDNTFEIGSRYKYFFGLAFLSNLFFDNVLHTYYIVKDSDFPSHLWAAQPVCDSSRTTILFFFSE